MQRIPLIKKIYYLFLEEIRSFRVQKEFKDYKNRDKTSRFKSDWSDRFIYFSDKTNETFFDVHYIYHPAWALRVLMKTKPEKHFDFSSTLSFCAQLSALIPVKFYDYRPANIILSNLETEHADLTQLTFPDKSLSSMSCMHVLEHIGLGRYGDPIDPEGDIKAMKELKRVAALNGDLLIVVPVGSPRIQFNAHRIYSYELITDFFTSNGEFELNEFALIPDNAIKTGMIYNPKPELVNSQEYACGCWWFKKVK